MMTPEQYFLAEVQTAYDHYVAAVRHEDRAFRRRLGDMDGAVSVVVGRVSALDWEVRNGRGDG